MKKDFSLLVLRLGISLIFLYFGILALKDPAGQGEIWLNQSMKDIITTLVSVKVFMTLLGLAQITVAVLTILGVYIRYTSLAAAALLLGIIINLGFNDIALRDFAILTAYLFLSVNGGGKYVLGE